MSLFVIAVRAVYFVAALQLFGLLLFSLMFSTRKTRRVSAWLVLLLLVAMAAWLALEAADMRGESVGAAMTDGTLGTVLGETRFGSLWIARAILWLGVGLALGWRGRVALIAAAVAAGIALALGAAAGHAGAESGTAGDFHLAADMLHLLAAGAWLGGLVPFARAMAQPASLAPAEAAARRFSRLGTACVGTILATGGVNAWFLVGTIPALFGTPYGRLLLIKIALFATMIGIAAINRYRLTPLIRQAGATALPALRRNSLIEAMLGLVVLLIVAVLGTLPPAYFVAGG